MSKRKLPPATDYHARNISDWNATSFREYLADTHAEKYGIPYTARSYAMEAKLLKTMIDEHGAELVKTLIDECFTEYKPTRQYPSLNFAFMYAYQRPRILPKLLADAKRKADREQAQRTVNDGMSAEELAEWF